MRRARFLSHQLPSYPGWIIRDLVLFVTENGKKDGGEDFKAKGLLRKAGQALIARIDSINPPEKAARNAKHT